METEQATENCISNDSSDNSDTENTHQFSQKSEQKKESARCVNNNKVQKPLCDLNSKTDYVTTQHSVPQTQSAFARLQASFTQVRCCKSVDAAVLMDHVGELKIEEFVEEAQPTNELDMLLQLFETEQSQAHSQDLEQSITTSGERSQQRKAPLETDGYAQQLYQTLETADVDYAIFKREAALSDANGIELLVKQLRESFGVHVAVVAAPVTSSCNNWLLVLDMQMASQLTVGCKLKAFFDNETIENAYRMPFSINEHEPSEIVAVFVAPEKIFFSSD